ncbi:MAG: GTP pyrophosphokinase family protein [Oscillospiraceae bacterium]|nr:GTP pyrophosphokinase family protein [Oscillospiraceae bacterium]
MENNVSIYGEHKPELEKLLNSILLQVSEIREEMKSQLGIDPVEHCLGRIKSEESMREKCVRKNLPVTTESALEKIYDAVGVRIVCAFVDDVFTIRDYIVNSGRYEIIEEKDYINTAKPNGYRSYHMILRVGGKYHAEIQLRTISMDTWAALEHHLKYKKKIGARQKLIEEELKRCADELASTDLSMQTIRDMILEGDN